MTSPSNVAANGRLGRLGLTLARASSGPRSKVLLRLEKKNHNNKIPMSDVDKSTPRQIARRKRIERLEFIQYYAIPSFCVVAFCVWLTFVIPKMDEKFEDLCVIAQVIITPARFGPCVGLGPCKPRGLARRVPGDTAPTGYICGDAWAE